MGTGVGNYNTDRRLAAVGKGKGQKKACKEESKCHLALVSFRLGLCFFHNCPLKRPYVRVIKPGHLVCSQWQAEPPHLSLRLAWWHLASCFWEVLKGIGRAGHGFRAVLWQLQELWESEAQTSVYLWLPDSESQRWWTNTNELIICSRSSMEKPEHFLHATKIKLPLKNPSHSINLGSLSPTLMSLLLWHPPRDIWPCTSRPIRKQL